uniref:Phospholipase/carboxylesterase/thioesterase domain-containing protein n=1 Tax=Triticum urartu TaxID=4572 RepID=A0A8R7QZ79_TRIUA
MLDKELETKFRLWIKPRRCSSHSKCSALPQDLCVFSGSIPLSKSFADRVMPEARKMPILWFHGMADGVVLFEARYAGCTFLQELGMACEFKTYPTLGHWLVDEELQYFDDSYSIA